MWMGFVICGGGCHIWVGVIVNGKGLSNTGGVCPPVGFEKMLAGFVSNGRDLSWVLSLKAVKNPKKCPYVTKSSDKSHKLPIHLVSVDEVG